jgi:AcrR family transcriptional regulator
MKRSTLRQSRAARTRQRLLSAFVELVVSRGSTRISPADVAARAGVGRSTLYTHFGGRLELLDASLVGPCTALARSVLLGSSASELLPLLRHLRDQSARRQVLFGDPLYSVWAKRLTRAIAASLRQDVNRARRRPAIPSQLLAPVLAELQLAIIRCWLADPSRANAETVAATLTASAHGILMGGEHV